MANAERPGRRLPLGAFALGAACLVCCLPLFGGLFAAASGMLAGLGVAWQGAGGGVAIGSALVAMGGVLLWARRRSGRCSACGGTQCAC